jgi:hypothetical protein
MKYSKSLALVDKTRYSLLGSLECSSTALNAQADNTSSTSTNPSPRTEESVVSGAKSAKGKKRSRSRLVTEYHIWVSARVVAPGQVRQAGSVLKYLVDTVMLTVKLYTKTVSIETVQRVSDTTTCQTYPIEASFRTFDLKGYLLSLKGLENVALYLSNSPQDGCITSVEAPLTIPMVTLPFRLLGFKPSVIKSMSDGLNLLLVSKGLSYSMDSIQKRHDLGDVRAETLDKGKVAYSINGIALSNSLVREIRSVLTVISSTSNRPRKEYLDQIKCYFFILKTSVDLLKRLEASEVRK